MKIILKRIMLFGTLLMSVGVFSQNVNISIDLEKQRFLDGVSNLDRTKYFNNHDAKEDPDFPTFYKDNNVGFGRQFWGPFAFNGKGNFNNTPPTSDGIVRPVNRIIFTYNPTNIWSATYNPADAVNTAIKYWVDQVGNEGRPEYWEPFNEPFIKASKFTEESGLTNEQVVTKMCEWFREMAKAVHNTPELARMKVIGFSSAFPSYARRDFSETWQNHMKKFIDIAGADIDAISVHPYDGVNQVGQANGRSGSNSEAILDLIESYTAQKFGTPKKLAITEYGVIENDEAFPPGPAPSYFNEARSAVSISGLNNMLFNFLERQDNIEICIPFVTGRADFFYQSGFSSDGGTGTPRPYTPAITRPTELYTTAPYRNNQYVLSYKANFYRFWKDIKGDRAKITSDDLDVQVQAFVDGNITYIAINNLDDADKTVNLNFISGPANVTNVNTSSLIINGQNTPIYEEGTDSSSLPTSVSLKNGETKLLKITYGTPVQFTSSIVRKKYYATSAQATIDKAPTVLINADEANTFTFNNVVTAASGDATLRLSVGIPLTTGVGSTTPTGLDRLPSEVTFNGTALTIPTNWKGYDQSGRNDFYGMLEFNVPYNLIINGSNTVSVTYAKTGGRLAAAVLSVENDDTLCTKTTLYADEDNDGLGNPAVTIQSCGPVQGFVDNADDKCIDDAENICLSVNIPGTVEAENFSKNEGVEVNTENTFIQNIDNGDATEYDINATIDGEYKIKIRASSVNGGSIKVLNNNTELTTINITATGGLETFQDFEELITLSKGRKILRLEYIGTGANILNVDNVVFETNEAFVKYVNPESDTVALTITNTQTSFSFDVEYATKKPTQSVDFNLRAKSTGVTGGFASIRPGAATSGTGTFTINLSDPLPADTYEILIFINSPGDSPQFFGGPSPQLALVVIEPAVNAANDESKSNPRGSNITLNILSNDSKEDGNAPLPSEVNIDINTNMSGQQTQLIVANEGTWSYNEANGKLTFTPNEGFTNNPTDIEYVLTEISNGLSDRGTVNFEYVQEPIANNDISSNNNAGAVAINIISNDTNSGGVSLSASQVTVDLDISTPEINTTLSAGVLGNWSYNTTSGVLTFTPSAEFSGNPPSITYQITENSSGLSNTAEVTVTYKEFTLAEFTVTNTGEVCANNNDGSIVINANSIGNYSVAVSGAASSTQNFTESLTLDNLDAGNYRLEITDNETSDIFIFNITISEPLDLSVTSKVSQKNKSIILNISGSEIYTINLNNTEFTTSENSLTLPLQEGVNVVSVKGEKDCQGKFNEKIVIGSTISVYPNPVKDTLQIITGTTEEVLINLHSVSGTLLKSKKTISKTGESNLDVQNLASGVYFVSISTPNSTSTFKILK
ncbi:carbohydrate-binding protein [Seonamhaeicola algicola]|uniref:Carbohydrate-binding protein n=2 Tax=Seonamhaeicola TaxID=1649495 RepID=A0A5C7AU58_9FLAO|nr:carbohydrate-binding protein [Seonamhaeicola algicola]TXE11921.1 carbohydrate-binding protein [Seonamhaeicola algicola]